MGNSSKSKLVQREKEVDFRFGFNKIEFSDRILHLEIVPLASVENIDVIVRTFHINSHLFAAKSPFFLKLFNNGMKASQDEESFSLRINESEEAGFMDLLNSVYNEPLKAAGSWDGLVDVLMLADKFMVACCVTDCVELLLQLPMTMDRALFLLEFPSIVIVGHGFEPLKEHVIKFLGTQFRNFTESRQEEAMALPLWAIEGILGSKGLRVTTEDVVFQFILKWARLNFPKLEERQPVVRSLSARFVCPWLMGSEELKGVMDCPDMGGDYENMFKQLLHSLVISQEDHDAGSRVYMNPLVKVVQLNYHRPRCVAFLDLHKCIFLSDKQVSSATFRLGCRSFYIVADCGNNSKLGLYLHMKKGSQSCDLDAEFAAISNWSNGEFKRIIKLKLDGMGTGWRFIKPWAQVMNKYLIDGIMHLRLDLTIVS